MAYRRKRKAYARARRYTKPKRRTRRRNARTGGFLGAELKFVDFGLAPTAIAQDLSGTARMDPTEGCLNGAAQGDGPSNRDGRKMVVTSITVKGVLTIESWDSAPAQAAQPQTVRVAMILDTQANQDTITPSDVFLTPAFGQITEAHRNLEHLKRYKVLSDRTYVLRPHLESHAISGNHMLQGTVTRFMITKRMRLPITFSGVDNTIGSITDNAIHILCWKHSDPAVTANLEYATRVRFMG